MVSLSKLLNAGVLHNSVYKPACWLAGLFLVCGQHGVVELCFEAQFLLHVFELFCHD